MFTRYRIIVTKQCYSYKTLLQLQNIDKTPSHPTMKAWGTQITMDKSKQLVGKMEKMSFSSGSESRDGIRRSDSLRKRVPSRRGGVCEIPLTIGYCTDRWTMEDRVVRRWAKLTGSGVYNILYTVPKAFWERNVTNHKQNTILYHIAFNSLSEHIMCNNKFFNNIQVLKYFAVRWFLVVRWARVVALCGVIGRLRAIACLTLSVHLLQVLQNKHLVYSNLLIKVCVGGFAKLNKFQSEITMEVGGWVQVSQRNVYFGKSSQNSPILVLIFWLEYYVYFFCMYTLLKVVSHYRPESLWLEWSVHVSDGFPKKFGYVSSIQFFYGIFGIFLTLQSLLVYGNFF